MNRNVTAIDRSTTRADWETPPAVFRKLNEDFGPFDIDLTSTYKNSLCNLRFGPGHVVEEMRDALDTSWSEYGTSGYSNPPYGPFVPQILAKAVSARDFGFSTTLLLPMRVTKAFLGIVLPEASALYFCDKRICFFEDGEPRWNKAKLHPKCSVCDGTGFFLQRGDAPAISCAHCERGRLPGRKVPDPAMFDSIIVRFTPSPPWIQGSGPHLAIWHVPPHTAPETY